MEIDELYSELLIEYAQDKSNQGSIENADFSATLVNPLCGDQVSLSGKVENDILDNLKFEGTGCSISMASSAILCDLLKGKTLEEARNLIEKFEQVILQGKVSDQSKDLLGDALIMQGIYTLPARHRCALLAWENLKSGIDSI